MAVVHALIIKSKPSVTDAAKFAAGIKEGYEKVDIVKSVRVGSSINSEAENKGYNFTLLLEFEDEAVRNLDFLSCTKYSPCGIQTLKGYLASPELQAKKAEFLDPNVEGKCHRIHCSIAS